MCVMTLASAVTAPNAGAVVASVDIGAPAGPLTHVAVGADLSCQIQHTGDTALEFYPSGATPGDCGTFVAAGGKLWGPDFTNHSASAASNVTSGAYTPYASAGQTAKSGAGTSASPFRVTTSATTPGGSLAIAQVDSYVEGQESYRTDVVVKNNGGAAQSIVIYRAGDCYLQNSDDGAGFTGPDGAVGCSANPNNTPAGRIEEWVPITPGANFFEAQFTEVWSAVASQMPFPNQCARCGEATDNGSGISWSATIQPGQTATFSHYTTFSPTGRAGPPPTTPPSNVPSDVDAARTPSCLSVPSVIRNRVARVPGVGNVVLATRQVDNPARPLKLSVRVPRGRAVTSTQYIVNGRTAAVSVGAPGSAVVSVLWLKLGSRFVNRITAVVVLAGGVRVTLVQRMVILRCSAPAALCTRLGDGRQLRCTSGSPIGGRRARVTVTRSAAETATGSATVIRGRYTVTVRGAAPLAPGVYAFKAVITSARRGERFQAIRRVTVR
jgi:hypothetical protein